MSPTLLPAARTARLFALAAISGLCVGLLGGAFRLALDRATGGFDALVAFARTLGAFGWMLPVASAALAAAVARAIVRLSPLAGGSGIQYVEAVARGVVVPPMRLDVIPVKFVGGVLAIGAGLALGREGPTVQMAARVAALFVRLGRLAVDEARLLRSAVAGAGLGVAFNAPLGGAMFVFEELWRGYPPRLAACTLLAVVMSHVTAQLMLGNRIDFPVHGLALAPVDTLLPALLIGGAMGLLGVAYNRGLLATMDAFQRARVPPEARAAAVGALAGLVAWLLPVATGGGENLISSLLAADGAFPLGALLTLFAVRLVLSPLSYAAGTPGGLFAPVLVIGALGGALVVFALQHVGVAMDLPGKGAVLIGMSAFLAATVRAPLTGIALVLEMSASATYLMPMLAACFAAVGAAELLGARPIYDSMIDRIRLRPEEYEAHGSPAAADTAELGPRRA